MSRKTIWPIIFIAIIFAGFWLGQAECAINLRLTDPKVRLSIAPGQSKSGKIAIENPTEQPIKVRCYLEDWFYTDGGDGGKEFRAPSTTPLSCASWINFSPSEFTLNPFGRELINYVVSVPADAQGGYYAVLFFETEIGQGQDEQGFNVLILGRLGSLFYVQTAGVVNKQAILKDLTVDQKTKGFEVTTTFKNTGNVDITASGGFNLIDQTGLVFARGQFNQAYTFPEDEVLLSADWSKAVQPGIYDLIITLDLGGKILVEEYQLQLGQGRPKVLK